MGVALGFYPLERLIYPALWLTPTLGWAFNQHGLPLIPLVIVTFGAVAWARLGGQSKVELPQPATTR
jgi:hypothetical protein